MIAGMTVWPVRSTRAAPGGASTAPAAPTWVKRPSSTTNAAFSTVVPSPTMSRPPSNSTAPETGAGGWAGCAGGGASCGAQPASRQHSNNLIDFMTVSSSVVLRCVVRTPYRSPRHRQTARYLACASRS